MAVSEEVPQGHHVRVVFRAWRTLKDGTRLWARQYGKKAWRLELPCDCREPKGHR